MQRLIVLDYSSLSQGPLVALCASILRAAVMTPQGEQDAVVALLRRLTAGRDLDAPLDLGVDGTWARAAS